MPEEQLQEEVPTMSGLFDLELCQGKLKTVDMQQETVSNLIGMIVTLHTVMKKDVDVNEDKKVFAMA